MTGLHAARLSELARRWLCGHSDANSILLRDDLPVGDGSTGIRNDGIHVNVGFAEFVSSPDADFRTGVALTPFVALFHEVAGHVMQLTYEFNKSTRLSKVLFLSECASKSSGRYYGIDDNGIPHPMYFSHPHEIAAQYMGIKCGYDFLSCAVGSMELANDMMMDYVAYRRELGCEFLPDDVDCENIDAVLKAMDKEFQNCIEAQRPFEPDPDDFDALSVSAGKRRNGNLRERVKSCTNGLRQDGMMTCMLFDSMCSYMPNETGFLMNTKVYNSLDLNFTKMFTRKGSPIWPPPRYLNPTLSKLSAITDNIDSNAVRRDAVDMFGPGQL